MTSRRKFITIVARMPLMVMSAALCVAAGPATLPSSAPIPTLNDPAFWLERASAEWSKVDRPELKPWRAMAATQLAMGDSDGLAQTLAAAQRELEPPKVTGQAYARHAIVRVYASLIPIFSRSGDEAGMRHAVDVATDASRDDTPIEVPRSALDGNRVWVAELLAEAGRDAEAFDKAAVVRDPGERLRVANEIALEAARGGRNEAADRAFALAAEAADVVEKTQGSGLRVLADGYLAAGRVDEALRLADARPDHTRAMLLAQASVVRARAGAPDEAAQFAKRAIDLVEGENWDRMFWVREVARGVAEANDPAGTAALVKLALKAKVVPAGPGNVAPTLPRGIPREERPVRPSALFAMYCFTGLAEGAAARGDVAAARKHMHSATAVTRAAGGDDRTLHSFKAFQLPVAEQLAKAGLARDAVTLIRTSPFIAPARKSTHGPAAKRTIADVKLRCAQIYAQAGDFKRAAELSEEGSGGVPSPLIFAKARARAGQLHPLLHDIEADPAASVRCAAYASVAEEVAKKHASAASTQPINR